MSAIIIGILAGMICFWACTAFKARFGYDDSLDAFGIHGVGGTLGALLTGVFATKLVHPNAADGLLYGNPGQLLNQLGAVAGTWICAAVMTFIIVKIVDALVGLRVSEEEERTGLDQTQHGESGYNLEESI